MAAANGTFPPYDSFYFDPQMHYAQVLAEARKSKNKQDFPHPPLIADVSCFSGAHFKAAELQRSLEDLKKRRSWKKSFFFFWRKSEKKKEISSGNASQFKSWSGPLYMNEVYISKGGRSGPLSGRLTPRHKGELQTPYMPLHPPGNMRAPSPKSNPIYWIT